MADEERNLHPETLAAMEALAKETAARRKGGRPVSEVINEDPTPRPYSVRLSAREIHRLRVLAGASGVKPSELARQFILDGLLRLEAKLASAPVDDRDRRRILDIKQALLNAYDLVESLEEKPSETKAPQRRKQA
jgi:hypothetical protein